MIESFRHKGLKKFWEKGDRRHLAAEHVEKINRILDLLHVARSPQDLNLPGYALHPLSGNLKSFWSVTVRANWRIIFRFEEGRALDVDYVDYH